MSHEIAINNGKASMAYVGATPWHGLGQQLTENATIETWITEAGMDYEILPTPVLYNVGKEYAHVNGRNVLYRSDNNEALGLVSNTYKVVQPKEVMEFFRSLAEEHGFKLETAGALFGGKKYWALARTPHEFKLGKKDTIKAHLMLATACDGSMSTSAKYVQTRVVCNNTIAMAIGENSKGTVKTRHNTTFKSDSVKEELGLLSESWKKTQDAILGLSKRSLNTEEAVAYMLRLMGDPAKPLTEQANSQNMAAILKKFEANSFIGSDLAGSKGTAWGLVNCVTEWIDHDRGRGQDRRLEYAYFGGGMDIKQKSFEEATLLI